MNTYARHLATLTDRTDVVAIDDVRTIFGDVLLAKGVALDHATADVIARNDVQIPIERSIRINEQLSPKTLRQYFQKFIAADPSMAWLHQQFNFDDDLKSLCYLFLNYPILRQKLTVLSYTLPAAFEQAIFCAWLGSLLCKVTQNSTGSPKNVFLAAMCHDLGMVHVHPDLLAKTEPLSWEECRQRQAHPLIGYNILSDTPGMDPMVARAVLEHHEHLDGTGYPNGLFGKKISAEGQLLKLLTSVESIYTKHFRPFGRPMNGLIPIIQMNEQSYHYGSQANHLVELLEHLPNEPRVDIPHDLASEVIVATKAQCEYIMKCEDICSDLTCLIGFRHNDLALAGIQNTIIHISMSASCAGVVNHAYLLWLDQVEKGKMTHAYPEVEETYLITREIMFHLRRLQNQIRAYLNTSHSREVVQNLEGGLKQLRCVPLPVLSEKLADF
jgi:HD domain